MDWENKYGTLEIQKELLRLLKGVHDFCVQNDIKYSIAYGSLLGAVRHHGFIPWDDDLDIMVDRDNYEKIINKIGGSSNLILDRAANSLWIDRIHLKDSNSINSINSTCDIFLIDDVPNNKFLANLKLYTIYALQGMMKDNLNLSKGSLFLKICSLITFLMGRLFSLETKIRWYTFVSQWLNDKGLKKRCYNASFADIHCIFSEDLLCNVHLAQFEDTSVYVIDGYDSFLKSRYGDYMTLPTQTERVHKHF